jgi:hypothetical protein
MGSVGVRDVGIRSEWMAMKILTGFECMLNMSCDMRHHEQIHMRVVSEA